MGQIIEIDGVHIMILVLQSKERVVKLVGRTEHKSVCGLVGNYQEGNRTSWYWGAV